MLYNKIPKKLDNIELYETYDESLGIYSVTLKTELKAILKEVGEPILCVNYETEEGNGKDY